MIAALEKPDSGTVVVDNCNITELSEDEAALFRADHIGFVFQFFALISVCTIRENLSLIQETGTFRRDTDWEKDVIDRTGIHPFLDRFPHELSGGQQQRAAIAAALMRKPDLILADEPTGNLDRQSGIEIMRLLKLCQSEFGITVIMVTHDLDLAKQSDQIVELIDGKPRLYETKNTMD